MDHRRLPSPASPVWAPCRSLRPPPLTLPARAKTSSARPQAGLYDVIRCRGNPVVLAPVRFCARAQDGPRTWTAPSSDLLIGSKNISERSGAVRSTTAGVGTVRRAMADRPSCPSAIRRPPPAGSWSKACSRVVGGQQGKARTIGAGVGFTWNGLQKHRRDGRQSAERVAILASGQSAVPGPQNHRESHRGANERTDRDATATPRQCADNAGRKA
jgi:hypothetical protein